MQKEDIDQVLAIETASFSFPWSRRSFEAEFEKEFGVSYVALIADRIVGYLIAWLVADEVHIANIAVHPEYRKQGLGRMLMEVIFRNSEGFSWIGLEVRRSNKTARAMYKKLGFQEVGIRKNYYVGECEDAILMVKRLYVTS